MDIAASQPPEFQSDSSHKFWQEWLRLREDGAQLTSWEALSEHISADLMTHLLVDEHVSPEPIIRFMGSELVHMWGYDVTGLPAPSIGGEAYSDIRDRQNALMLNQPCGCLERVWSVTANHKRIFTEAVFLPLATAEERPARFAIHITMLKRPMYDFDNSAQIGVPEYVHWLDLGYGVPPT